MPKKKSFARALLGHRTKAAQFLACSTMEHFAKLLNCGLTPLQLANLQPGYHTFRLPKKDGTFRIIEAPVGGAKAILKKLNGHLQAVYYGCMSAAAYGYIDCPEGDPQPRHIAANARRHLGCAYLLNIDLDNFFHQVSERRVCALLQDAPFAFPPPIADWLAGLATWHGRLPMGSPTSPALSNFATRTLDEHLVNYCGEQGITVTRYVDDLSFSSAQPITEGQFAHLQGIVQGQGYAINYKKVKWYGPGEAKSITGLVLGKEDVEAPPAFLQSLDADLQRFRHLMEVHDALSARQQERQNEWLNDFEESLEGRIRFLIAVYGRRSRIVRAAKQKLEEAYDTTEYLESRSWMDFEGYV